MSGKVCVTLPDDDAEHLADLWHSLRRGVAAKKKQVTASCSCLMEPGCEIQQVLTALGRIGQLGRCEDPPYSEAAPL